MKKNLLDKNLPGYVKYFFILSAIILTLFALIITQSIFKPLLAALIISLLLKPLCAKLEKLKIMRGLSAVLSMLLILIIFTILSFFIFIQIKIITSDLDSLTLSFNQASDKIQQWTDVHFGIAPSEQIVYFKNSFAALLKNSTAFIQNALTATADFFTEFLFFLIALFFFLYYRSFFTAFLMQIFSPSHYVQVKKTLHSIEKVVRKYILGLCLVILTTATLNILGLFALGLKHAIFFGSLAGVLTIIPYFGIVIGSLLPFLFAIATTDSIWYPVGVLLIFGCVQFLEGNFITPNMIGKQVSLNPFAALLVLFFSGMFFGLLGIILSLPVLAITKVIFDNIAALKPFGYLIGHPPHSKQTD